MAKFAGNLPTNRRLHSDLAVVCSTAFQLFNNSGSFRCGSLIAFLGTLRGTGAVNFEKCFSQIMSVSCKSIIDVHGDHHMQP